MSNETRVKESLNLIFHGLKVSQRETMFAEVRQWLQEMDPKPDISLSDFEPDVILERMRAECDLREMAAEYSE